MRRIGIIGGGQLGRMTCFAAHAMGFETVVFTDQENSPASFVTNNVIIASYSDKATLQKFADQVDLVTFEFENIPLETAEFVESLKPLFPKSNILKITQNRLLEKGFLNSINVKTADFAEIKTFEDLENNLQKFGKAILKTATMGYDGKGQFVIENGQNLENIWTNVQGQKLILEKFCPFESECSVIVARSQSGEIKSYEPLTNIHKDGILDESIYPARISETLKKEAQLIAEKIALEIGLVGVLAVEMFILENEVILVNELAPRPHNSGHFSMDSCITSQFEQLIRAINDLKLGSTNFHSQGFMKNLIGDEINHLEKFHQNAKAKIHLYGKKEVKSGRKMGHVNVLEQFNS